MWRLKPIHTLNLGHEGVGSAIVLVETVDLCPSYRALYHRFSNPKLLHIVSYRRSRCSWSARRGCGGWAGLFSLVSLINCADHEENWSPAQDLVLEGYISIRRLRKNGLGMLKV